MTYLTRNGILNADDRPVEDVHVPTWGGTVRVRALSAATRDQIEGEIGLKSEWNNVRAKAAVEAIVDENGEPVFTAKDIGPLGKKSGAALDQLFDVIRRLSGMETGSTQEAEGNSEPGQ